MTGFLPDTADLALDKDPAKGILYDLTCEAIGLIVAFTPYPVSDYAKGELGALRRSMAHVVHRAYGVPYEDATDGVNRVLDVVNARGDLEYEATQAVAELMRLR